MSNTCREEIIMRKIWYAWIGAAAAAVLLAGCAKSADSDKTQPQSSETTQTEATTGESKETTKASEESKEEVTLLIAAAASLENCMVDQLIPMFEAANPGVKVEGTYDSSGKLQTQIEEGAEVDVFVSAATKQMNALNDEGLMDGDTIKELLENKIVLIVSEGSDVALTRFEDILNADTIAVGDPKSVPAGQYAKEAFESLGIWDQVEAKASLGSNVVEVLNWVGEGSAQAGVVYSTDAASNDKVKVVAEAPEGSVSKIIYPAGMVKASAHPEEAKAFLEFLSGAEAMKVFESYGFAGVN